MTTLLEQHGQGGHSGFMHPFYYHNSFLIADSQDAWVLEAVERRWVARQVKGVASISNCLTIGGQFDLSSVDLVSFAQRKGWSKGSQDFDFARDYSDFIYTTFARGRQRCQRTQRLLKTKGKEDTIFAVFATLRDHDERAEASGFQPDRGIFDSEICAHVGFGPVRAYQTTGSLLAYMHSQHPVYFVTGTAAPCTSIFKPVWLDAGLPDLGPLPTGIYDPATLFWQHERLHRLTMQDYSRLELYRHERDELEERFVRGALGLASAPAEERLAYSARCFAEASSAEMTWLERISKAEKPTRTSWHYALTWKKLNQQAEMRLAD
jgi:dipeptidase